MKRTFLYATLAACLIINLVSCGDGYETMLDKDGIAIQTVAATSEIDLDERTDWVLKLSYLNNSSFEYNYTINDGKLTASSAKDKPYRYEKSYMEGDKLHPANAVTVRLASPTYYYNPKSASPTPPRIQDQSTLEKFKNADLLSYVYQDVVTKDIKDVVLTHDNTLLDFVLEGIPTGAIVKVYQSFATEITPLYLDNSIGKMHFQAIVLSGYPSAVALAIDEKYYTAYLTNINTKVTRNTRYSFRAKFDGEKMELTIEDLKSEIWD